MSQKTNVLEADLVERVISLRRVSKTGKGNRRLTIVALVAVGDRSGCLGVGKGRGADAALAVRRGTEAARSAVKFYSLKEDRTFYHDVKGKHGAASVILRSAMPGKGIIAGGAVRFILSVLGVRDVVAKSLGSSDPYNLTWATLRALSNIMTPEEVMAKRGIRRDA